MPNNLAFLDFLSDSRKQYYRTSKWLKSDFDSNLWLFEFANPGSGNMTLDFNVVLSNGTLLTDAQNIRILNTFKYWINSVTHPDNTRGRGLEYADATVKDLIERAATLIDYFLIHADQLKVDTCGLQAITGDHLKHLIDRLTSTNIKAESIYDWSSTLTRYLLEQVSDLDNMGLLNTSDIDFTSISDDQKDNDTLSIPFEMIPHIRCWLWRNNFYRKSYNNEYRYLPITTKLTSVLYGKRTLRGDAGPKPTPAILCMEKEGFIEQEYPAIPVSSRDESSISKTGITAYRKVFNALLLLQDPEFEKDGLLLPPADSIYAVKDHTLEPKLDSRFTSLPSRAVLDAVKQGIEFHIKHADSILWSFDNLLAGLKNKRECATSLRTSLSKVMTPSEFIELMHPDIRKIGVEKWTINKDPRSERYDSLRSNKGFSELIRVYYGASEVLVAALMARRQRELITLKAGQCLDNTGSYLIFRKAKSTKMLAGLQSTVVRPIDKLAVEMILILEGFQKSLIKHGYIDEMGSLFDTVSTIDPSRLLPASKNSFNTNLDYFCDYFETPLHNGKRYYIRTHQLRRFFALCFFWGSGFGGMETLRWFMGQTDPAHLYRYITENSPGEVLRHAKSQFLSETINEHEELVTLIKQRYGTDDFTLINTEELEPFIDDLINDGVVEIEPDFIKDANGNYYKIVVTIRGISDAN